MFIVHSQNVNRFWECLLRQKLELVKREVQVFFAGEAAADDGGPLREFLALFLPY